VSGNAESSLRTLPASVRRASWNLADPTQAGRPDDEILGALRALRDEIRVLVDGLFAPTAEDL
jgi:hypothetical protein